MPEKISRWVPRAMLEIEALQKNIRIYRAPPHKFTGRAFEDFVRVDPSVSMGSITRLVSPIKTPVKSTTTSLVRRSTASKVPKSYFTIGVTDSETLRNRPSTPCLPVLPLSMKKTTPVP